ncbi:titin isoform X2 [Diachasmimorpha longicaudata]|uniref:titin isoform X2 n=1 Tax=Diachasmimorpha longicaudata TaxID=58733 RepID=UPI0030B8F2B5
MSETPKMGVLGSKEEDKSIEMSKEDSPERYEPYSVDRNADTYDTEALSIMDINDIIGVQTEPVGDSTLEGEMAALSAMMTEAKSEEDVAVQDELGEGEDGKEETGGTMSRANEGEKDALKEGDQGVEGRLGDSGDSKEKNEQSSDIKEDSTINKSLQLIGEAYISDDSQDIVSEEEKDKKPKVVFSCKPLVDKQSIQPLEDSTDLIQAPLVSDETEFEETVEPTPTTPEVPGEPTEALPENVDSSGVVQGGDINPSADSPKEISECPLDEIPPETLDLESASEALSPKDSSEPLPASNENCAEESKEESPPIPSENPIESSKELETIEPEITTEVTTIENDQVEEGEELVEASPLEVPETCTEDIQLHSPQENVDSEEAEPESEPMEITEEAPSGPAEEDEPNKSENFVDQLSEEVIPSAESISKDSIEQEIIPAVEAEVETDSNADVSREHQTETSPQGVELEAEPMEVEEPTEEPAEILAEIPEELMSVEEEKEELVPDPKEGPQKIEELVPSTTEAEEETGEELLPSPPKEEEEIAQESIPSPPKEEEGVAEESIPSPPKEEEGIAEESIPSPPKEEERMVEELLLSTSKNEEEIEEDPQHEESPRSPVILKEANVEDESPSEPIPSLIEEEMPAEEKESLVIEEVKDDSKNLSTEIQSMNEDLEPKVLEDEPTKEIPDLNEVTEAQEILSEAPKSLPETQESLPETQEFLPETQVSLPETQVSLLKDQALQELQESLPEPQESLSAALEIESLEYSTTDVDLAKDSEVLEEKAEVVAADTEDLISKTFKAVPSPKEISEAISEVTEDIANIPTSPPEPPEELQPEKSPPSPETEETPELAGKNLDSSPASPSMDVSLPQKAPSPSVNSPELEKNEDIQLSAPVPEPEVQEDLFEEVIESLELVSEEAPAEINEKNLAAEITGSPEPAEDLEQALRSIESSTKHVERSFNLDQQQKMDIPYELLAGLPGNRSPPSKSEISELESAVKFLQESEEQETMSPLVLSPTLKDNIENSVEPQQSFRPEGEPEEMDSALDEIITDSIDISEAEIISEAVKLESERKRKEEATISPKPSAIPPKEQEKIEKVEKLVDEPRKEPQIESKPVMEPLLLKPTRNLPKVSILEERLREPPKIEIPMAEPRMNETSTIPKPNLLIQRDQKSNCKMLDSPKCRDESKVVEAPRKDHDKHEIENIGSPRIILKIAKSAIADCAEPRSPKSPKIRSAANSPNPEDSPGQKLGKIRMKLSRSGHPSIISNEASDEVQKGESSLAGSSLSPLGMKIKLSKSGDASIVQPEKFDPPEDKRLESPLGMKIKLSKSGDAPVDERRLDSPLGMKIKLSKSGEAPSIVPPDFKDLQKHKIDMQHSPKRTDSPLGMKFKLSRTGDASIIQQVDKSEEDSREIPPEAQRRTESPLGVKIKLLKGGDASIVPSDHEDELKRTDSPLGMKMKISKKCGASILDPPASENPKDKLEIPELPPRRTESPLGMKIKLSKSGDASIIHPDVVDESNQDKSKPYASQESSIIPEATTSPIGMKIKLSKTGDATIIHKEDVEVGLDSRKTDSPIGVKIKLSKTGDASIIQPPLEKEGKSMLKSPDTSAIESMKIKLSRTGHHTIITSESEPHKSKESQEVAEVTIEPVVYKPPEHESFKRKEPAVVPLEVKKFKLEAKLSHILPDVTIQPVVPREHKPQSLATSVISRQQMNVIKREISITQVRSLAQGFNQVENEPEDVEIIEPHPELIIVNENSNSSQDVMIIDEVPPLRVPEVKVPKKRGRPRRIGLPVVEVVPQDPLALDEPIMSSAEPKENERPKRTCSRQKSYAPPKRGRGRGRGKRKLDRTDYLNAKKPRLEQNLTLIESRTTSLINLDDEVASENSSELYKVLSHPLKGQALEVEGLEMDAGGRLVGLGGKGKMDDGKEGKETFGAPDSQNWLTPSSKKILEGRSEISTVQVIDEETRMSAESFSRSQTPARSISVHAGEPIINEESQGSVLSTATTESEKVKVKNRRMEISFDPDEGPFTVEKIAEYEWPTDRKGDTFMIQEQISQYLGVKSFKRKYPDLKRRMVDMEERNHLRENGLVSESMCDMGLTAVCSSEVLDIMCSDFPDQYEEYRKHMREKQIKEHSKKQKELTAAANAEKNRIDLAEMAVQSALSWNVGFNKARKESRKCSLDLQTFTIHVPKKQQKVEENTSISHYPVALIPGQYTDYYREYTPAELRYYPLNTVLYGPMRPNERKFDSQSEGSQSDSDSDTSSDDSSSSSSDGTQDTEGSQSTMDDVDIELSNQKDKSLKCKMCLKNLNKFNKAEVQIQCGTCNGYVHPSCIDLTLDMVPHIQAYAWQCTDCKTCAQCHDPADEDKMLFCDMCDRGYHIYCVGLRRVPQGRWHCQECAMCASCGSREPGGMVCADRNSVAQWQHEYKKGDKNTRVYVSTLCVPCSKLFGEQGSDNKSEKLPV